MCTWNLRSKSMLAIEGFHSTISLSSFIVKVKAAEITKSGKPGVSALNTFSDIAT